MPVEARDTFPKKPLISSKHVDLPYIGRHAITARRKGGYRSTYNGIMLFELLADKTILLIIGNIAVPLL